MVVASPNPIRNENLQYVDLPVIDLSLPRHHVSKLIVKACDRYGFFGVINHGVPKQVISRMEGEALSFFSKPAAEKQRAGPANPFGYGCKNIGFNGDIGDVEYLLLNANHVSIAQSSKTISDQPDKFSSTASDYTGAVRELACELLEVIAEGMRVPDTSVFSRLVRGVESDSLFRLNHYPHHHPKAVDDTSSSLPTYTNNNNSKIGFGEHTDPQILTLLRSNDVPGLQISPQPGVWVPVPSDPAAFWVNVGDVLQAMTNGRFVSVKHRAVTYSFKSRLSMAYFAGPPGDACITALPEMVTPERPPLYHSFIFADYMKTARSRRLSDTRINLYRISSSHE